MSGKRKIEEVDDVGGDAESGVNPKQLKLEEEILPSAEGGANFIEVDGKSCTHEVVYPKGTENGSMKPPPEKTGAAAMEFPFSLDPFQQTAINCLEAGDSVLVSAHTSAGKTVVAQYACAMALRDKTRVIYTSPLKALSNQKYRELYEEFQDVGLLTGDVSINPEATCLVVTTEVLRGMLYDSDNIVKEIKCVVYDEVHYLRDKERGVVWEECLILLPKQVQSVFLSATVPNAREFALWYASIHEAACHVVYTEYRPVPLQHYIFPLGANGLYMAIDERGVFRDDNFQKAMSEVTGDSVKFQLKTKGKGMDKDKEDDADIFKLVKMILQRNYDPVIVFCFSKKDCEALALQLAQIEVNDAEEKKLVEGIFTSALDSLSDADRKLPQVSQMLPMLKRGIGVHHSGLLPIVKEVIEILFQEGLLKVLFATETFSTGLNMPAKTVVFAGARKFDGGVFRFLYSGEYIQMSGRAGRRGLDDRGIVILMTDKGMDATICRDLLKGGALRLLSEFRLSYNMIINMMRLEDMTPPDIIKRSFRQFLCERSIPHLEEKKSNLESEIEEMEIADEQLVEKYLKEKRKLTDIKSVVRGILSTPKYTLPFLQPGRLLRVVPPNQDDPKNDPQNVNDVIDTDIWGAVVNFQRIKKTAEGPKDANDQRVDVPGDYVVDVLVNCNTKNRKKTGAPVLPIDEEEGSAEVIGFSLDQIDAMSSVRIYMPKDLKTTDSRKNALKCISEALKRLQKSMGNIPLLKPEDDMKVSDKKYKKLHRKVEDLETELEENPVANAPDFKDRILLFKHKQELLAKIEGINRALESAGSMIMKDELKYRQRVLRRLGMVDSDGVVQKKGQVALQINSADGLVLTDMIFNGDLNGLEPHELVAVCSVFIWKEGSGKKPVKLPQTIVDLYRLVRNAARRVGRVCVECKVMSSDEEFIKSFKPDLMEAALAWSQGSTFLDVMKLVDVFEGSLVRAMRQLSQVLREVETAVSVMGEETLKANVAQANQSIMRDVMFAASLYL